MKPDLLTFLLFCSVAFVVTFSVVLAYTIPSVPDGNVNDYADILTVEQEANLEARLNDLSVTEGCEIAIVTINSLDGDTIENTAIKLFSAWGIGKKAEDNGLLLLVAVSDREVRIEVGYGLEATITDAESSWIIRDIITPAFRNNNYYDGISEAVDKITQAINGSASLSLPTDNSKQRSLDKIKSYGGDWWLFAFIFFAFIFGRSKSIWLGGLVGMLVGGAIGFIKYESIWAILLTTVIFGLIGLAVDYMYSNGRASGGGGRGFGGGGFGGGGFGGGSSGGGGASGRW